MTEDPAHTPLTEAEQAYYNYNQLDEDVTAGRVPTIGRGTRRDGSRVSDTELDAVRDLFSLHATLLAAGGVLGAEGSVLLQLSGSEENLCKAETYFRSIQDTPSFSL